MDFWFLKIPNSPYVNDKFNNGKLLNFKQSIIFIEYYKIIRENQKCLII